MKFINQLSYQLAHSLAEELKHTHEKRRVYYYGLQVIIGSLVKTILLVAVTLILGLFEATIAVMLFFAALRITAGGYHMDNYTKCLLASFGIFLSLAFTVKYTYAIWPGWLLISFSALSLILVFYSAYRFAPADTPYKPITNRKKIKRLKVISVAVVIIWAVADIYFILNNFSYFVVAGCLGMLMAAFIISPLGYRFFNFVSGKKPVRH